jgi:plastocyanin
MMSTPAASATAPPPSASAAPAPTAPAAGAAGAVDSAPAASPQPAAAHANITGVVTTTPAKSAGLAVVYLENAPVVAGRGALAGVDNRQMSFQPFVSVIAVGGKVAFSNSDPFPHNVFSPDHERFDVGSVAAHATGAHVFKTPGTYSLLCNLHPNMLGYVLVSPSSYFAKANAKGEFTIKDVPPGTYQATAWAPRLTSVTQTVVVATGDAQLAFTLHR